MGRQVRFKAAFAHLMLSLLNSTATPILDEGGRVIAILAGRPKSETEVSWRALHDEAFQAMARGQRQASFTANQLCHRRGEFFALSTGASFGGGQRVRLYLPTIGCSSYMTQVPGNLRNTKKNTAILAALMGTHSIKRFAGFGSSRSIHCTSTRSH
jgi:hypothetical protein